MNIALVGCSGYGAHYLRMFRECVDTSRHTLCAVIDPFASRSPAYEELRQRNIPFYDTLESFYRHRTADLVIICSPIPFHAPQTCCALRHGSHVLCEKPLAATVEEALAVREAWRASGKVLSIGFQWSFSRTMQALKQDIHSGLFGRPLLLKTMVSWKRADHYYASSWKGRDFDSEGRAVHDSICMNAVAHYLHNCFFLMGRQPDEALLPDLIEGSLYRARQIETYDTCFLRGAFSNGCRFYLCASHVAEKTLEPFFCYQFEHADICFDANTEAPVTARFHDGRVKEYGSPQAFPEVYRKLEQTLEAIETGTQLACGVDTALAHLQVCTALRRHLTPAAFPADLIEAEQEPAGLHVNGLLAVLQEGYQSARLPDELGASWAVPSISIDLKQEVMTR